MTPDSGGEPLTLAELMPAPTRRRFPWKVVAGVVAVLAVFAAVGVFAYATRPSSNLDGNGRALAGANPGSTAPWSPPAKVYVTPVPADFAITVNELSRKCFGSAGCNVTFSIGLENVGAHEFDPAKSYKLVYTVNGTEDPYSNNVTITGDRYTYESEEFVQVKDKATKLTATVTSIVAA